MNRRSFVQLVGGTTVVLPWIVPERGPARAQEAVNLAALGLPEVTVTITDAAYEVAPATTAAGWTLVTLDNRQGAAYSGAELMRLPEGETLDGLMAMLSAMGPEGAPPEWIYEATFAGAPWVPAGATAQAVVLLAEGEWVVFSPSPLAPAALTVTAGEAAPADPPGLSVDREVEMGEFFFGGLEEPVAAGPQVWKVTTTGEQPHLMSISPVPAGTTPEQLVEGFAAMMPGPGSPTPDAEPTGPTIVGGCSTLSVDQSLYLALDLAAGTYGAVCFFPDPGGAPHVMLGMAHVFAAE